MNTSNVVSLPVSADYSAASHQYKLVSYTSTGIVVASAIKDENYIGTLLRGNATDEATDASSGVGMSASVHLADGTIHFVRTDGTAILVGSQLELSATDGVVALAGTTGAAGATKVGIALEANGSVACIIRAIIVPYPNANGV